MIAFRLESALKKFEGKDERMEYLIYLAKLILKGSCWNG